VRLDLQVRANILAIDWRTKVLTVVENHNDRLVLRYRGTPVVTVTPEAIVLYHGGYVTATTASRMNDALKDTGYRVYSHGGGMYLRKVAATIRDSTPDRPFGRLTQSITIPVE
jgi:hypothetical protein